MTKRRFYPLLIIALLMGLSLQQVQAASEPSGEFFQQSIGDYAEELEIAKEEGKKGVLLFFEQKDCPFCHYMKTTILNQPEVQAYFNKHFTSFRVDIEGDVEISDFNGNTMKMKDFAFKLNRVRATPVIAFYDFEGKRVTRFTGKASGVEEFMMLGKYVSEGAYKNLRFTKYKRQQKKQ